MNENEEQKQKKYERQDISKTIKIQNIYIYTHT